VKLGYILASYLAEQQAAKTVARIPRPKGVVSVKYCMLYHPCEFYFVAVTGQTQSNSDSSIDVVEREICMSGNVFIVAIGWRR
jgi:hypothetical protein